MKKSPIIQFLVVLFIVAIAAMAIAGGTSVYYAQQTLLSSSTSTTGAYTVPTTLTFDHPVNNVACDFITGPTVTTANSSIVVYGNQGTSSTLFDSTAYVITSNTLASSLTATQIKTIPQTTIGARPVKTISAVVTASSSTQYVKVSCTGVQ